MPSAHLSLRLHQVAERVGALTGLEPLVSVVSRDSADPRDPGDPPAAGTLTDLEEAARRVLALVDTAFADGLRRVEAEVPAGREHAPVRRMLHRAGLRPEGVARGRGTDADGGAVDLVRLARLADDPAPGEPGAFLGMLNATLPRKRLIAQGIVRDERGRVLLCELTYKQDWDLPGGVVDPQESPRSTLAREVREELGLELVVGDLLAVNWLPPYRQWEDALLLVFDLGTHADLADRAVLQPSELRAVHWVEPADVAAHVAAYVARHLSTVLAGGPVLLEDGLPA